MEETEALIKEPRKLGKNEIDMTSGPLVSKMLKFAIPLVLSGLLQLLFNAADLVVVGRFAGSASLAAVGAAASPVNMVVCLLIGLSTGVNVVVARAVGAGREKDIHEAIHTAILVAMIGGLILVLVGLAVSEPLLRFTKTPEEVLPLAKTYQDILFIGIPIMAVYNFGSAIFRARGDTKRPLIFLSVAGALNVALNLMFVIVFHLAVVGVALATVLSQVVSTTMILITLSREKGPFKLELQKLRLHKSKLIPILRMGIPAGIQGMMFSVSNLVVQSFINAFGKTVMAASSAASSLEG
ncbi:MAG: MATE family efflux transporter, partial [Firmicutes bacterium]|nr:MATE family efflux transporter [Bacillota bacterium]